MKLLLAIALLAMSAVASPTPRFEWERIDSAAWLSRNVPPIVRRLVAAVREFKPGVIRFSESPGMTRIGLTEDWDIFDFKERRRNGGLIVLLSEADEVALVRWACDPTCTGKEFAEAVRRGGIRGVTQLWGVRVVWGIVEPAKPEEPPEELPLPEP